MRTSVFLSFLMTVAVSAQTVSAPKAPDSGLLDNVPVISAVADPNQTSNVRALPAIDPVSSSGHQLTSDGSSVLLLRFEYSGAPYTKLHFTNFSLPTGAVAHVYAMQDGQAVGVKSYMGSGPESTGDFWTDPVPGDRIIVEVDWAQDIPADIPFSVAEIASAEGLADPLEDSLPTGPVETRTGWYRDRELTYSVSGGVARFEGDIILGDAEEISREQDSSKGATRYGLTINGERYRWPSGKIPYVINSAMTNRQRISDAVAHWNARLSGVIRLVPRTSEADYVEFVRGGSCSSFIGKLGGAQKVYISDACATGNVIHEIGHAVGLWHEHSRADRNSHVRILWENINLLELSNFGQALGISSDSGSYDFGSIMHYPSNAFSANSKPTIQTIPAGITIGQREGLSAGDIAAVRRMYGASVVAPAQPAPVSVSITISASASGQQARVDGTVSSLPRTFSWVVGSTHTVEAIDQASTSSTQVRWVRWSDGGAKAHTVTASTSLTALAATYSVSYRVAVSAASGGTVTVSPASATGFYPAGSTLTLQAQPSTGYCFGSWAGLLAGTPSQTTLTVNQPYTLQAQFQTGAFTLSLASAVIGAGGGPLRVGVTASSGCPWTVSGGAAWLQLTSGLNGKGSGVVTYSAARNTSPAARLALVFIAGRLVLVTQSGVR